MDAFAAFYAERPWMFCLAVLLALYIGQAVVEKLDDQ